MHPPETPADYVALRAEIKSRRRHAAWIAFSTGIIGGAVGAILVALVAVWAR